MDYNILQERLKSMVVTGRPLAGCLFKEFNINKQVQGKVPQELPGTEGGPFKWDVSVLGYRQKMLQCMAFET